MARSQNGRSHHGAKKSESNAAALPGGALAALVRQAAGASDVKSGVAPFACLTCYDAVTARWLARAGVPLLLVGDTAAEMVLGYSRTIDVPLDFLIALTAGVKRGAGAVEGGGTVVMGDMPFLSYHTSESRAIENAGRFLTEGLADIVKLEADATFAPLIEMMVRAGIPVCGHVGTRPQRVAVAGYAAAGRTAAQARQIVRDAKALEAAGCSMLLIEAVPAEVADMVLDATTVPVIGIGAGTRCHGQVLVLQDLLGLSDRPPRFAEPIANFGRSLEEAAGEWVRRVAARAIGGQGYQMKPGESEQLGGTKSDEGEEPPRQRSKRGIQRGTGRTN
jgi:3-methyl-2-oxobutanoate hydroxymethyltransferase